MKGTLIAFISLRSVHADDKVIMGWPGAERTSNTSCTPPNHLSELSGGI